MPALIPKEVEIQRLKKIWLIVIAMGSVAASVQIDNFVDGSLHQTAIRDSAFTPAHWWLYSHFVALPLGWAACAMYDRKDFLYEPEMPHLIDSNCKHCCKIT